MSEIPLIGPENAIDYLAESLKKLKETISGRSALAYSGGLDSSVLLHFLNDTVAAYTLGVHGSADIANGRSASKILGVRTRIVEIDSEEILEAASHVREIDPEIKLVDLGYEVVFYILASEVREDSIVTGQGADEIFYGYQRFMNREMSNKNSLERLLTFTSHRERRIAQHFGKRLITPYLDPDIIKLAELPREWHIKGGINKYLLRCAALKSGMPESVVMTRKKAAQFGSGVQKVLQKEFKRFV